MTSKTPSKTKDFRLGDTDSRTKESNNKSFGTN